MRKRSRQSSGTRELASSLLIDDRIIGGELERFSGFVDRVCDLVTTVVGGAISAALDGLSHSAGHKKETR
jgi:hypothetical protein